MNPVMRWETRGMEKRGATPETTSEHPTGRQHLGTKGHRTRDAIVILMQ